MKLIDASFNVFAGLEEGMVMYDAMNDCQVFVQCPVLFVACDNPRASEFAHHMGSSANHFCRICDVCQCFFESISTVVLKPLRNNFFQKPFLWSIL